MWISLTISLKWVWKVRINNIPSLVQIMAWRRPGDKPLSEPMMVSLLMHICVSRPQWVNSGYLKFSNKSVIDIHVANKLIFPAKSSFRGVMQEVNAYHRKHESIAGDLLYWRSEIKLDISIINGRHCAAIGGTFADWVTRHENHQRTLVARLTAYRFSLTHWGRLTLICVSVLDHRLSR